MSHKTRPIVSALVTSLFIMVITVPVWAEPNFEMVGFATLNGGTTGGKGGQTVTVTSYSDLKNYAESSSKYIIMVKGTMSGGAINIKSNKSIIGVGNSAYLKGIGFGITSNNIIIRNLKMTLIGNNKINGGDVISIHGSAKNIWIDHCELFSEDPDIQKDIDKYDGLNDVKGNTGFITFSWNYFHDHHKCGIVGASDSDLYGDRKITFHHNYYNKIKFRIPMYRGSTGHFFNNYIVGAEKATEIRVGTCLRVERNYYEPLTYSIYTPTDARGKVEMIDNIEVKRSPRDYPESCKANIPYTYSQVLIENPEDVKTIVPQYAGIGKIDGGVPVTRYPICPQTLRYSSVEAYDLMGKLVYKGILNPEKVISGIHVVVRRDSKGGVVNRSTQLFEK